MTTAATRFATEKTGFSPVLMQLFILREFLRGIIMNYEKIYSDFIASRRLIEPEIYAGRTYGSRRGIRVNAGWEHHHIIPVSMGGNKDADNIITLTHSDHYFAHLMLATIFGGSQWCSVWLLSTIRPWSVKRKVLISSRKMAAIARLKYSEAMRGENHPGFGKKHSAEHKAKISKGNMGHVCTEETRKRISDANIGRARHTPESREKLRLAHTGRKLPEAQKAKIRASAQRGSQSVHAKRVICVELNQEFGSIADAAKATFIRNQSSISTALRSGTVSGGYHWKYA